MKKYIVAVLGGILLTGSVSAATFHPLCEPSGGGTSTPCADTTVVTSGLPTVWTVPVLYATDVQTAHIGTPNGDFTYLQVGSVATLNIANVNQLNTNGLSVSGDVAISGNIDIVGWLNAGAAALDSLSLRTGGTVNFWDNSYASLGATSVGLRLVGNQILEMKWDGKGTCRVRKSLPNGTATEWSWLGDDGLPKSTTTLAGVPTSCLSTP